MDADEKGVVVIYIYAKLVIDTTKRYIQDISPITISTTMSDFFSKIINQYNKFITQYFFIQIFQLMY